MIVSIIVAMDEARCIGVGGRLPWHLKDDLQRFKALTMGHHLIMGRVTYESIGRLLPGRTMIVVTRQPDYLAPGCLMALSIEEAIAIAEKRDETEVFIIGGAQIYARSLHLARRLYLTRVHTQSACDVVFPEFDLGEWREIERQDHPADEQNEFSFTYSVLAKPVE